jgi:hypothetical protein
MKMSLEELQETLENHTNRLRVLINENLKNDGDKECDSQRMCLLNSLSDFEDTINGIQEEDLKGNE